MDKRSLIQILSALLHNGNLSGFFSGRIWQGTSKSVCVPVLNCYSCPGALGSCPIGSLQSSLAGTALKIPFYVIGLLLLFGLLLGRMICGWLCPFGFVQDLLYKIPSPKLRKNKYTKRLSKLKYFVAIVFVILLPIAFYLSTGVGSPAFCKYICPAGTLEAGIPLVTMNSYLRDGLGFLFAWKIFLLAITLIASVFIYRPFCRFICPLGAWYGLFNKLSFYGVTVNNSCIGCNKCIKYCKMDCEKVGDAECINCGECRKVCPVDAIEIKRK